MKLENKTAADRWRLAMRRRWMRRGLAIAAVLAILAALHRPLLRGVAGFLIVERPFGQADYLAVLPSVVEQSSAIDEAVRRYSAGEVHGIVLFEPPMSRAVRCGAWPDPATTLRDDLVRRGVPSSAVILLSGPCRTSRDAAEALRDWLRNRPSTKLLVLGRLLRGRYDRRAFDSVLDARQTAGLGFAAAHSGVDQNDWWRSREGILLVFQNYAALGFEWWNGPSKPCKAPWTLEEFENSLPPAKH